MKKNKWYRGLSLADEKYVAEANPDNVIKPKINKVLISLVAACACIVILCSLWLYIPFNTNPPDVSRYSNSEYYSLIQKLNVLTYNKPKYKNNAEKLWANITSIFDNKLYAPTAPDGGENLSAEEIYQEITDNQVEGIIEADRIKRSDTHIYYLDNQVLRIFSIDKENTEEVGSFTFYDEINENLINDLEQWEFYLSNDCKTATVITENYNPSKYSSGGRYVNVISLDVSDPTNIVEKAKFQISGAYMSSRMSNGNVLLLTEFSINRYELDFDDESTFLPQIDEGNGAYSISVNSIVSPENLSATRYTVVMKLDDDTLDLQGTAAYLSYSEDVYVSDNHVFLTHAYTDNKTNDNGTITRNSMTDISCLTYGGDTFERKGNATVRGNVKDQWSMDEYNGILRVFTTNNATTVREQIYGHSN
ncbi:hypothetical protein EOM82_04410, partial [bacterium]|nr:hypothetical protein [bacterium]